jgi:cytochrome c oxidase subunit 4
MTEHAKHGPSSKDYVMVFVGLAVLTGVTVGISYSGLGEGLKTFLSFAIATVKALLVALLFMHLRYEPRTIVVFAVTPVLLAVLFIVAISPDIGIVR